MYVSALFLSLIAIASAAPTEQLQRRDEATCGNAHYSSSQVAAAASASCNFVKKGTTAGSSTYPHQYKNFEGFDFKGLSGPFYEFPIKSGGTYTGGSPGADRVIINKSCQEAGVITHTGSNSRNGFVACEGNKSSKDDKKSSAAVTLEHSLLRAVSGAGAAVLLYIL